MFLAGLMVGDITSQSFHLTWIPGHADVDIKPSYEVVLWSQDLKQPLSSWTAIATSSPPVTVSVSTTSGFFAVADIYTNLP